jgi:vacuolar-type H+-ATPase subunit I/STV1
MPTTKATHDIHGRKIQVKKQDVEPPKTLSEKEKDLQEIISKIENVHSKAVKKLQEIQKDLKSKKP